MTWLAWRQFRTQAGSAVVALAAAAVALAVTGPRLARLTGNVFDQLSRADRLLYWGGIVAVALAPVLLGAFWGAPLVARELEAGTHRLAWSQSVTRTRWLAVKLGLAVLGAGLVAGVLSLAVGWWAAPLDGAVSDTRGSLPARLTPVAFAMRGVVPVGYAAFAVVLGTVAGVLLRRSLAAMAVTLALVAAVQVAVPLWVRPHLLPPARETATISMATFDGVSLRDGPNPIALLTLRTGDPDDWILSNRTVDAAGRPIAALPGWFGDCLPPPSPDRAGEQAGQGKAMLGRCLDRLDAEGYRQQLVYQPAARFWPLQWAETVLYLAGAALLAGFCFWWTRRRLS